MIGGEPWITIVDETGEYRRIGGQRSIADFLAGRGYGDQQIADFLAALGFGG